MNLILILIIIIVILVLILVAVIAIGIAIIKGLNATIKDLRTKLTSSQLALEKANLRIQTQNMVQSLDEKGKQNEKIINDGDSFDPNRMFNKN